ncbi:MAG: hypothetical protein ABH857_02820 [Elusimicrobiota bacterium]
MKQFKILILFYLILLAGCSPLEMYRLAAGNSITYLERCDNVYSGEYNRKQKMCFNRVINLFFDLDIDVFNKKKYEHIGARGFNKKYANSIDTTDVGIFFEELDTERTRVKVVSNNYDLAQYAFQIINEEMKRE